MSLDKKAILKEIEVLIRSIKVHYDNIENEHRIPTIELELITSKIRKLHEKSIVYNHIHYLEEEQLQSTKRLKFDHIVLKHAAEEELQQDIIIETKNNEFFETQIKFEEKILVIDKSIESENSAESEDIITNIEETKAIETAAATALDEVEVAETIVTSAFLVEEEEKTVVELIQDSNFTPKKLGSKIGINDRFRFIKNLFGGNGAAMEASIKEIENCQSNVAFTNCMLGVKQQYQWNEEDENVIDFMAMLK